MLSQDEGNRRIDLRIAVGVCDPYVKESILPPAPKKTSPEVKTASALVLALLPRMISDVMGKRWGSDSTSVHTCEEGMFQCHGLSHDEHWRIPLLTVHGMGCVEFVAAATDRWQIADVSIVSKRKHVSELLFVQCKTIFFEWKGACPAGCSLLSSLLKITEYTRRQWLIN